MYRKTANKMKMISLRLPRFSFPGKPFNSPSIKNKFSLVIAVFIITSVLITGLYIYVKGSQVIVGQNKNNMVILDKSMTDNLNQVLAREVLAVSELTHRPVIAEYLNASSSMEQL